MLDTLGAHAREVTAISYHEDLKLLITASNDKTIRVASLLNIIT